MDKGKSALRLVLLSCWPNNTKGEEYRHDNCAINPTNCQESFRNVFQRYRELLSEKLPRSDSGVAFQRPYEYKHYRFWWTLPRRAYDATGAKACRILLVSIAYLIFNDLREMLQTNQKNVPHHKIFCAIRVAVSILALTFIYRVSMGISKIVFPDNRYSKPLQLLLRLLLLIRTWWDIICF